MLLDFDFDDKKRKSRLTPILTTKKVDFGVNEFHSIMRVYPKCSLPFIFLDMTDLNSRSFFIFELILGFERMFGLFKAIYEFIKVFMVFYKYFGSRIYLKIGF